MFPFVVFREARFLTKVSFEREMILSPDAAITLVFQTGNREIWGLTVGSFKKPS
jgi:hypothetical protein